MKKPLLKATENIKKNLIDKQVDIPVECAEYVENNFWQLIDKS